MKEKIIKIFALICLARIILYWVILSSGYMYTFRFFEPSRILLYVLIVLEVIALSQTEVPTTKLMLVSSLIVPTDIFQVYLVFITTICIVILVKNKKRLMSLAIVSACWTLIFGFVYFLPCGNFITHTSFTTYDNIDEKFTVVVSDDYSFTAIKQSYVYVCEKETLEVLGHTFYKCNDKWEPINVCDYNNTTPSILCTDGILLVNDREYIIK